jgi:hypothetical protein
MASFYGTRYYNSDGSAKTPPPTASTLGLQEAPVKQAITTTHLGTAGNRVYLVPLPGTGPRTLTGVWFQATDMDSGAGLDVDLVLIYSVNGVEQTPIIVVDTSALSIPLTAAVAMQWIDIQQAFPNNADGLVHLVALVNVVAGTAVAGTLTVLPHYQ